MPFLESLQNRLRRLALPGLLKVIALYQLLVWALILFNPPLAEFLTLDPEAVMNGQIWRLFTFAFVPQGTGPIMILLATWFLIWMGASLENAWGAYRLNVYFGLAMLGLIIAAFMKPELFSGRSGPESGLLYSTHFLAFATLYPNEQILLFFLIPVRVKWLGWLAALTLLATFAAVPPLRWAVVLSHANYLLFFGPAFWQELRHRGRVGLRRRKFESQQLDSSEVFHQCHACSKTDQSDPHLEFRVAEDGEEYCVNCLPKAAEQVPPHDVGRSI
ncbi:MAG: rhomboid family intramembrane serine protease [Verrucomicrobiales bacterium]